MVKQTPDVLVSCQGSASVVDYAIQFCINAAKSGWNDTALRGAFLRGLKKESKEKLRVNIPKGELPKPEMILDLYRKPLTKVTHSKILL